MPFCPQCHYEFVEGITQCADCQVDLVESLPSEEQPKERFKWVPVQTFPGTIYAEMIQELLEKNNIPCLVNKGFLSSAYGIQGTGTAGVETKIYVPENKVAESEEIIKNMLDRI